MQRIVESVAKKICITKYAFYFVCEIDNRRVTSQFTFILSKDQLRYLRPISVQIFSKCLFLCLLVLMSGKFVKEVFIEKAKNAL